MSETERRPDVRCLREASAPSVAGLGAKLPYASNIWRFEYSVVEFVRMQLAQIQDTSNAMT